MAALNEETVDDLLYFARAGETQDLREALAAAVRQSESSSTEHVLTAAINDQGNSLLHYSCANGHLSTVEYLLPLHPLELLLRPNSAGNTPLHWAALNGNLGVVKALTARIEQASSQADAAPLVHQIKADQRAREAERKRKAAPSAAVSAGPVTAEEVRREDDEEDHRPLWDCRNDAGRGPMSEAQLAEKEEVVQFLLEHSLAGAPPAPTDEEVGDADTDNSASKPAETLADTLAAATASEQQADAKAGDANGTLADGLDKATLQ
ncbi:ankyrin repeat-containing protein [Tilletia horrida]|nr:ankyrin repeat-containing protein [Tilletia horrida]